MFKLPRLHQLEMLRRPWTEEEMDCVHRRLCCPGRMRLPAAYRPSLPRGALFARPGRFFCRGRVECKYYTSSEADDSRVGASNALMHVILCCPYC
jgi:hypothetical protein